MASVELLWNAKVDDAGLVSHAVAVLVGQWPGCGGLGLAVELLVLQSSAEPYK